MQRGALQVDFLRLDAPGGRAASTLGVTRSTTSPAGATPFSSAAHAAPTAPHESCSSTTTSGQPSTSTPYSMLPSTSAPTTWPAGRASTCGACGLQRAIGDVVGAGTGGAATLYPELT